MFAATFVLFCFALLRKRMTIAPANLVPYVCVHFICAVVAFTVILWVCMPKGLPKWNHFYSDEIKRTAFVYFDFGSPNNRPFVFIIVAVADFEMNIQPPETDGFATDMYCESNNHRPHSCQWVHWIQLYWIDLFGDDDDDEKSKQKRERNLFRWQQF